jgi:hypothetical protein
MAQTYFDGDVYNDDRMFLLYICQCTVEDRGEFLASTIYHERMPDEDALWCIVTFKNTPAYPATRIDHFPSQEHARAYFERAMPGVPLISLQGRSPTNPVPYSIYRMWEVPNGFSDYNYRNVFSSGGSDAREVILTPKKLAAFHHSAARQA